MLLIALAGCASAGGGANPRAKARMVEGMDRLGASAARRECFAEKVDQRLGDAEDEEAARIVENARSRDEMREGVLAASERVRRAFIVASLGCSLSG